MPPPPPPIGRPARHHVHEQDVLRHLHRRRARGPHRLRRAGAPHPPSRGILVARSAPPPPPARSLNPAAARRTLLRRAIRKGCAEDRREFQGALHRCALSLASVLPGDSAAFPAVIACCGGPRPGVCHLGIHRAARTLRADARTRGGGGACPPSSVQGRRGRAQRGSPFTTRRARGPTASVLSLYSPLCVPFDSFSTFKPRRLREYAPNFTQGSKFHRVIPG